MNFKDAFNPIRSIGATFETMNKAPAQLWGGGLLLALFGILSGGGSNISNNSSSHMSEEMLVMAGGGGCCFTIILFLLTCWIKPGVSFNLQTVMRTGEPDTQGIFDSRGRFVDLAITSFLKGLVILIGALLLMVPVLIPIFLVGGHGMEGVFIAVIIFTVVVNLPTLIYLTCGLALVEEVVIFEGASVGAAFSRSWNLARGNRMSMVLYGIVNFIFTILGVLLCCVGVIATSAVSTLAWSEAYLRLTEEEGDQARATQKIHEEVKSAPDEDADGVGDRRIRLD